MVCARSTDVDQRNDLLFYPLLQWMLHDIGVHAFQPVRDFNAKVICERNSHHAIASIDLMAQANGFYFAVAIDKIADTHHRVGEIDEPCIGTFLLHIADDFEHRFDVSCSMGKAAGSAVFGIGLAHTIFEGNLKIGFP